ncbi:hypothetical protein ASE96_07845 [Arthrobacter sp. Leaf69]|nr:hypothetical protein ASE96_07845 [Arthrobacter sp. Leaf69]
MHEFRLGYLVPEFPGNTHSFFWRELDVLRQLHVSADVVSTRSPENQLAAQEWAATAQGVTTYLAECSIGAFRTTISGFRRRRPGAFSALILTVRGAAQREATSGSLATRFRVCARQLGWVVLGARLAGLARLNRWQHVHVHSCGNSAYIAMYAHLLTGLPYSLTLHGPLSDYGHNQNLKWSMAAFGVVITEGLKRDVESALGTDLPCEVEVSPMGVDVQEFTRHDSYLPWPGHGPLRVFSCGRLNPSKGHDVLLLAVQEMVENGTDVQLVIAGEDELGGQGYRRELERMIVVLGLESRVRLLGAAPAASVRSELVRAHLFALASHAEPLGVAIMEAMSMGVPVVVTDSGGVPELVDDRISGILVRPGRPDLLAASMLRAVSQPDLCRKLGAAGRRRVESSFSHQGSAKTLARLARAAAARSFTTPERVADLP